MKTTFTIEEFIQAAEQNRFTNTNDTWLSYGRRNPAIIARQKPKEKGELPVKACVIGEAFINLGFVPNGYTPYGLSRALTKIKPDDGVLELPVKGLEDAFTLYNLADFINTLNGISGYRGKKRIGRLIRKYFSQSLDKEVTMVEESEFI